MPNVSKEMRTLAGKYIEQPTACAQFPRDIYYGPKAWMEKVCNVQRYTLFDAGGHFAAMEKPALFVADVKDFFLRQLGSGGDARCERVVSGGERRRSKL
jgi:pimeloyl-ACP methyl ester carboxylesterase